MTNRKWLTMILAAMLALSMSACSGGGDEEDEEEDEGPEDASGAGIWFGSLRVDGTTTNLLFRGVVTEEGDYALHTFYVTPPGLRQFFGQGATNGNSFSANAVTYLNLQRSIPAAMQGTVIDGASINGSYAMTGESATFSLTYQRSLYERPASLAILQGVYAQTMPAAVSVVIEVNGAVTINYPNGCVMNGTASVPHSNRNYYRISGTLTGCGAASGPTNDIAYLEDEAGGQNNRLTLSGQNTAQTFGGFVRAIK